ncbi:hypothetical protein L873DRAFT_1702380, partial [Choiromyces venosus 120613-1]
DVSHYCLRIDFMLQDSKISLQQTPSSNLHSSGSFFYFFYQLPRCRFVWPRQFGPQEGIKMT